MIEPIEFDLDRGMRDVKTNVQLMGKLPEKCVARMSAGHHYVCRQGNVCGAHGPDVQIVHVLDAGLCAQQGIHVGEDDAFRHAVEQQV